MPDIVDSSHTKTLQRHFLNKEKAPDFLSLSKPTQIVADLCVNSSGRLYLDGYSNYAVCKAISCLIEPIEGDRIVAFLDGNIAFILHILHRRRHDALTLSSGDRDLHITSKTLQIACAQSVTLSSPQLQINAINTTWIGELFHQVLSRLFIQTQYHHRVIGKTEEVSAKRVHITAQSYQLSSSIASLNGSAVLKIDGGQIHMG